MVLSYRERIDNSIGIVRNTDMSHDDKNMVAGALMTALCAEMFEEEQREWRREPGVLIVGLLALAAAFMVLQSFATRDMWYGIVIGELMIYALRLWVRNGDW